MLTFRVWSFLKAVKKLLVICVAHIPVTGDTLFEELMVTLQKTKTYLLNRKHSLILGYVTPVTLRFCRFLFQLSGSIPC